jgi:hypothetical protein
MIGSCGDNAAITRRSCAAGYPPYPLTYPRNHCGTTTPAGAAYFAAEEGGEKRRTAPLKSPAACI